MTVQALAKNVNLQALDLALEQPLEEPRIKESRHNLHESVNTTRSRSQQAFAKGVSNTLTAQHFQQKFNAKFAVSPEEQFGGGDTLGSKAEKIFANLRQVNGGRPQLSELGDISDAALIEAELPDDLLGYTLELLSASGKNEYRKVVQGYASDAREEIRNIACSAV